MVRVNFKKAGKSGDFDEGSNILQVAECLDVCIESLCGGEGTCGKCKVKIEGGAGNLSSITGSERLLLSEGEIAEGFRLACMAVLEGGEVDVKVPAMSERDFLLLSGTAFGIADQL